MRCPFCAHEDSQVKDSRPSEDGAAIRRRRQCEACGARFTTFERVQLRDLTVVKKDGKREPFDRDKLARVDRPSPAASATSTRAGSTGWSSSIQRQLETRGDEVTTTRIGEAVMDGLKALDHVAYIRFASIYKDFSEPGDFAEIAERGRRGSRRRRQATTSCCERRKSDKPVIVLVRPQLGQNIGKAARAMLNFGLTEMRLVAPRDGWPNPDAGPAASGADVVLERAQVFDTVAEAIADCSMVFASTVRRRDLVMPVLGPDEMADAIAASPERSAILFGPERSGLETEDVALANAIVTVPINPDFGSLNLAQAVILLAYEWSRRSALAQPPAKELEPPRRMASSKD